jgi:hypothetical protein
MTATDPDPKDGSSPQPSASGRKPRRPWRTGWLFAACAAACAVLTTLADRLGWLWLGFVGVFFGCTALVIVVGTAALASRRRAAALRDILGR